MRTIEMKKNQPRLNRVTKRTESSRVARKSRISEAIQTSSIALALNPPNLHQEIIQMGKIK